MGLVDGDDSTSQRQALPYLLTRQGGNCCTDGCIFWVYGSDSDSVGSMPAGREAFQGISAFASVENLLSRPT